MAIVKMSKFNLFVFSEDKDDLLHELQKFKYIHFQNLNSERIEKETGQPTTVGQKVLEKLDEEIRNVNFSINTLKKYETRKTGLKAIKSGTPVVAWNDLEEKVQAIDYVRLCDELNEAVQQLETVKNNWNQLNKKVTQLKPWLPLEFPPEQVASLKQCNAIFGTVPKKGKEKLVEELEREEYTYWKIINEDKNNAYIFVISHIDDREKVNEILNNHPFTSEQLAYVKTPSEEMNKLIELIEEKNKEMTCLENSLKNQVCHLEEFELVYEYLMMKRTRFTITDYFISTERGKMIEGYIPSALTTKFVKLLHKNLGQNYYLDIREASEDDSNVPIILDNSKFAGAFESLTEMYALPKYNEIDPTPLFCFFYGIFFGMMVADVGYGLLLLIGTFWALKRLHLTDKQKSFVRFFYYLSFFTIFWGAVYGSFFGDIISLPALIHATEQFNFVLVLSIAMGIFHIFFALGVQGYIHIKNGKLLDALFDVGFWYLTLSGGMIYLLSMFVSISPLFKQFALVTMILGMGGILLTGGRKSKGIGGKIGAGLYSLYGISSYIGDFVSYSRLMALGLSSAFIASAINMIVGMLFKMGFLGVAFGIVVFLVGQVFNLFLSLLGSYVHTIRLTYVEFFGKFYEGGGIPFKPFRSQSKYIQVK